MSEKIEALESMGKVTPLMKQYLKVKAKHPDAILLFRVGDFYETFGEDAITTSRVLGIVLTNRNNGGSQIELAGFPYHSLDTYLPKLVKAGFRVALCEQLEKPSPEKKIVKRGVTEIVTPGVATSDQMLDHKTNNFLAAIAYSSKDQMGIAFLDVSTGEFMVTEGDTLYIDKLIQSFAPSEILIPKDKRKSFIQDFSDKWYAYPLDDWSFAYDYTREKLLQHFQVTTLKGFGIEELPLSQCAAGSILHYLASTENNKISHIQRITRIQPDNYMWLDRFTVQNLELLQASHGGGQSLIKVLDKTITPMGGRLLKKMVVLPLKNRTEIENRHELVAFLAADPAFSVSLELPLRQMGDLERLVSKVAMGKINPREVKQLQKSLEAIGQLKITLGQTSNKMLLQIGERLNPCALLHEEIERIINEDPPVNLNKGGVIADGADPLLDDLRNTIRNSQQLLLEIQQREAEATGITGLKIGFNNVFGYYLEVTNKYKGMAPSEWTRKQTLSNAERYITEELKILETKILGAEEKILVAEEALYQQLVLSISDYIPAIQQNASLVGKLDVLASFARVALKNKYVRPEMNDGFDIDITQGRHPVIEQQLTLGEAYVPNDIYVDKEVQQVLMITGPNMSGKSALLRQTALICLMAQMGSFVPAASAKLGILDKIFTRVGASDNISSGESTFMVEMNETANIMNNISDRSLILLDEIGRGTSTYDGISIAWSIAEFLHENPMAKPKTLFATHYHELNNLTNRFPRIQNFHVATREVGDKVIFLRTLVTGGSEHSFGIHVAKMAGMPKFIVDRANVILKQLEQTRDEQGTTMEGDVAVKDANMAKVSHESFQLSIFETADPNIGKIRELLNGLDINALTPIDCMMQLHELKKLAENC